MRVQDVMTEDVQTMAPDDPAEDAWELMRRRGFHHVVVTSESGAVVGILSDRDAGGTRGSALRRGRTVEDLMTRHVVTVDPSTTVRRAANLMRGRSIGCVVVTNRGRVAGIVTVADLLELVGRGSNRPIAATKRWTLKHRTAHRKRAAPTGVW